MNERTNEREWANDSPYDVACVNTDRVKNRRVARDLLEFLDARKPPDTSLQAWPSLHTSRFRSTHVLPEVNTCFLLVVDDKTDELRLNCGGVNRRPLLTSVGRSRGGGGPVYGLLFTHDDHVFRSARGETRAFHRRVNGFKTDERRLCTGTPRECGEKLKTYEELKAAAAY